MQTAAWLNRACGCTVFTMYDIDELPEVDLIQIWKFMTVEKSAK